MAESAQILSANRFAGCVLGQCLADAIGFIVEGDGPEVCSEYVDTVVRGGKKVLSQQRRGRFLFGQYSDDSQLARELMLSLQERRGLDPSDYAKRICDLFAENRIVGRGIATDEAARRLA